jgi:hypothetical protein
LQERGVEVRLDCKVTGYDGTLATLSDGEEIVCKTLIWTAGTTPSRLLNDLPCEKQRGKIAVNEVLELSQWPGVYALGDCALIADRKRGGYYPPTAQHALRHASKHRVRTGDGDERRCCMIRLPHRSAFRSSRVLKKAFSAVVIPTLSEVEGRDLFFARAVKKADLSTAQPRRGFGTTLVRVFLQSASVMSHKFVE